MNPTPREFGEAAAMAQPPLESSHTAENPVFGYGSQVSGTSRSGGIAAQIPCTSSRWSRRVVTDPTSYAAYIVADQFGEWESPRTCPASWVAMDARSYSA